MKNDPICCSQLAANAVDFLIRDRESIGKTILLQKILARLVSTIAFPILASVDVVIYSIPTFVVSLAAPFSDRAAIVAKKFFLLISKSLIGVCTSPLGLLSPDLVSYHFLPKQHLLRNQIKDFGQIYSATVAHQEAPTTIQEVQELVQKARENKQKIGVGGTQLAQGGHTLPSENHSMFISMRQLKHVRVDAKSKTATVGAGAIWEDVQKEAIQAGLALQVMQASNMFSVGGSLSTNVHGWDHRMGSLINTVKSVTIVDAEGNIRKLNQEAKGSEEKKLFNSVVGGYGLFGIIVEAELELTNDDVLSRQADIVSVSHYAKYFNETIKGNDKIALHYGRISLDPAHFFKEVISVKYTKSNDENYKKSTTLKTEVSGGSALNRILFHTVRRIKALKYVQRLIEHRMFLRATMTSRNETMCPDARFIESSSKADGDMLQEYFVPPEGLEAFLNDMGKIVQENQINLINATIRYVKKDEQSTLAYARKDCFAVVICFNQSLAEHQLRTMERWTQQLVQASLKQQGTFYLPYHRFPTLSQFQEAYPNWKAFVEHKKYHDPRELFSSQFYTHYF